MRMHIQMALPDEPKEMKTGLFRGLEKLCQVVIRVSKAPF